MTAFANPRLSRLRQDATTWLKLAAALAILSLLTFVPFIGVEAPAGVVLLLFVPGAVIRRLVLRRSGDETPEAVAGALHSVLLSTAVTMLVVVAVSAAGALVRRTPMVLGVDAATMLLATAGLVFRPAVDRSERPASPRSWRLSPSVVPAAAVLAAALGLSAVVVAATPSAKPAPFTSLYMTGHWTSLDHPLEVHAGERLVLPVVVANHTGGSHLYRLAAEVAGAVRMKEDVWIGSGQQASLSVGFRVPKLSAQLAGRLGRQAPACTERLSVVAITPGSRARESVGFWLQWPVARGTAGASGAAPGHLGRRRCAS
jgi:uncharacterized membrane protein